MFLYEGQSDGSVIVTGLSNKTVTHVDIPLELDGRPVVKIGDHAFSDCSALESVTISSSITSIGRNPFRGTKIKSIVLPATVKNFIDGESFDGGLPTTHTVYCEEGSPSELFFKSSNYYLDGIHYKVVESADVGSLSLDNAKISVGDVPFTASYARSKPVVTLDGRPLNEGVDYTLEYENDYNYLGTATVIVRGMGAYSNTSTVSAQYEITKPDDITYDYTMVPHDCRSELVGRVEPTCIADGYETYSCPICGIGKETKELPALGGSHEWESELTVDSEPTCDLPGQRSIHCARCGAAKEDSVLYDDPLGHDFGPWETVSGTVGESNCVRQRLCTRCGYEETATGVESLFDWVVLEGESVQILSLKDASVENVVIPDKINGLPVRSVAAAAFANCGSLVSVTFPSTLEAIEDGAFSGCVSLSSVSFPASVEYIGQRAFADCTSLESASFSEQCATVSLMDDAFSGCALLSMIDLPQKCESFSFGSSVFSGCTELKTLRLPNLENVNIRSAVGGQGSLTGSFVETLDLSLSDSIPDEVFRDLDMIKHVVFSDMLKSVGAYSFASCSSLQEVILPASIESIGGAAFAWCSSLREISLPTKEEPFLVSNSFVGCGEIGRIVIPSGLRIAGEEGRDGQISYAWPFADTSFGEVVFEEGTQEIQHCIMAQTSISGHVSIPEGVTAIGDRAFYGCQNLPSVSLPSTLMSVGEEAFTHDKAITSIELPSSLKSIGRYAFAGLSISSIVIPEGITTIPEMCFQSNEKLNSITLPSGLMSIESLAFAYNPSLESVVVPDSVTSIDNDAFIANSSPGRPSTTSVTLWCGIDSYARSFAEGNGIDYKIDISKAQILPIGVQAYTGKPIVPEVTVTVDGATVPSDGYVVSYENNVESGTASIAVVGTGHFDGSVASTFVITDDHEWESEATVDKEPTCFGEGCSSVHCKLCGAVKPGSETVLEKLDHVLGDWAIASMPSCEQDGVSQHKCTICGTVVEVETIPAYGHKPGEWKTSVSPTCTADGMQAQECERCGKVINNRLVAKLGHSAGDWMISKSATCASEGEQVQMCTRCSAVVNVRPVAKTVHSPAGWIVEKSAACTAAGESVQRCSACGAVLSSRAVAPTGHAWGLWSREEEPTAAELGRDVRICSKCGERQTRPVEKLAPQGEWISSSSGWWYRNADGSYPAAEWKLVNGSWYHFDSAGYMQTGWLQLGSTWYYLTGSGAMATGWLNLDGTWYYLQGSGAMATGWYTVDNTWYYSDGSGAMRTGWLYNGGVWYYLRDSGAMVTGWANVGGTWYYLAGSGAMATGWLNLDGTWYYLQGSGAMVVGWLYLGGDWYYLTSSGAMATGWLTIDSMDYHFNGSGVWDD